MAEKENTDDANMMPLVQQAAEYLEKHQIYELFSSLMSSLAISRPSDPSAFIIETLTSQDPCKVCVVSNDPALSAKAAEVLASHFGAKIYAFAADAKQSEIDAQIAALRSATNFIVTDYPQSKQHAMALLDARVIPDRVFLLSHQAIDTLEADVGAHDLIALSNVFKHNARILCGADKFCDDGALESAVLSAYFEERRSYRNALRPRFAPRVAIIGPRSVGKTKLAMFVRDTLGTHFLSAAHVLAQHLKSHTELGIAAEKALAIAESKETERVVDDEVIVRMISRDVSGDTDLLADGFVLDDFPRTRAQAQSMRRHGLRPNRVIILSAKDSTLIARAQKEKFEFRSDLVAIPRGDIDGADSEVTVHSLLRGFREHIDGIQSALDCGCVEFDVEEMEWSRIEELAIDFVVQPLPKLKTTHSQ